MEENERNQKEIELQDEQNYNQSNQNEIPALHNINIYDESNDTFHNQNQYNNNGPNFWGNLEKNKET